MRARSLSEVYLARIEQMTFVFDDPSIMRRVLRDLEHLEAGELGTAEILAKAPLLISTES